MKAITDNAGGPTGVLSIGIAKFNEPDVLLTFLPSTPSEWLMFFSTGLVLCQLVHWGYRFFLWVGKRRGGT